MVQPTDYPSPATSGPSEPMKIHKHTKRFFEKLAATNRRAMIDEIDLAAECYAQHLGVEFPAPAKEG